MRRIKWILVWVLALVMGCRMLATGDGVYIAVGPQKINRAVYTSDPNGATKLIIGGQEAGPAEILSALVEAGLLVIPP